MKCNIYVAILHPAKYFHDKISKCLKSCADPESFVRGGPTLTTFFFSFFFLI